MQKYSIFGKVSTYSHSFGRFNYWAMRIFEKVGPLKNYLSILREEGKSTGFVATMGALHSGHLSLVKQAKEQNDQVIVTIFVNPTQFNNPEDLEKYPRDVNRDINNLDSVGCDMVFIPSVEDIYPDSVESEDIDLNGLDKNMEGTYRHNHFDGVATVVKRFFEIIEPSRAYFGKKDYQQYLIVKYVSDKLGLGPEVIGLEIERNDKGLALSSRNERLNDEEREKALLIYNSISWAQNNYENFNPGQLKREINDRFEKSDLDLEYVEICDAESLNEIQDWNIVSSARIFIAANLGKVRLIDNDSLF